MVSPQPRGWAVPSPATDTISTSPPVPPGLKAEVKRLLRRMAQPLFRAVKPLARPLVFRLRAYVNSPMQIELQQLRQRTDERFDAAARELQTFRQAQQQTMERLMAAHTLQVLQEIQTSRESLRQSLFGALAGNAKLDRFAAQLDQIESYGHAAVRRVAIACAPGEVMVRTVVGYVLCEASDHALIASLLEAGELEPGTRLLIQKLLRPEDTFVDVGANVGMHTLAAAIAMQGRGRIVAFEPYPSTHGLLRKTLWMNGFSNIVETHQAAASDRPGRRQLFVGSTSGHHSLFPLQAPTLESAPPVEVPVVRVDDVVGAHARVDLIKIDVEGAELEVLEGASSTISGNKDISLIAEFGAAHLRRTGRSTHDWLTPFERAGLRWGAIDPVSGQVRDATVQDIERVTSVNLFFARPDSSAWDRARSGA